MPQHILTHTHMHMDGVICSLGPSFCRLWMMVVAKNSSFLLDLLKSGLEKGEAEQAERKKDG